MSAPSIHALRQALSIAEQIQDLEAKLAGILGQAPGAPKSTAAVVASAPTAAPKKKYTMTAAHKAALVKAQKARWAKGKAAKPAVKAHAAEKPAAKKKGKMSAAGRANIVAAQKARWAKVRAAKRKKG